MGVSRHVALLRGINLDVKNSLPMKLLAEMLVDAGCGDVPFTATDARAKRVPWHSWRTCRTDRALRGP